MPYPVPSPESKRSISGRFAVMPRGTCQWSQMDGLRTNRTEQRTIQPQSVTPVETGEWMIWNHHLRQIHSHLTIVTDHEPKQAGSGRVSGSVGSAPGSPSPNHWVCVRERDSWSKVLLGKVPRPGSLHADHAVVNDGRIAKTAISIGVGSARSGDGGETTNHRSRGCQWWIQVESGLSSNPDIPSTIRFLLS